MEQTILTSDQKKTMEIIAKTAELNQFYLTGGTALAEFFFHHRLSEDLDYFSKEKIDWLILQKVASELKDSIGASSLRYNRIHDRYQFFFEKDGGEELKVEFVWYPFANLDPLEKTNGIVHNSLRDISTNKLMALLDRFDPKDFADMYFILQKMSLERLKNDTEKKFGIKINATFLGMELAKSRRIQALPRMLRNVTIGDIKKFFTSEAKKLEDELLED